MLPHVNELPLPPNYVVNPLLLFGILIFVYDSDRSSV